MNHTIALHTSLSIPKTTRYEQVNESLLFDRPQEVFVVFTDIKHNNRFYGLRSGFGHCFMLLRFADDWWVVDPLFSKITYARIKNIPRQDMIDLLLMQECHIVVLSQQNFCRSRKIFSGVLNFLSPLAAQGGMLNFGIFSCVTLIKRSLGIRRPWLLTPFDLYQFFMRTNRENY